MRNFTSRRLYSTVYSSVKVKKTSSVRDLFYTPVFKSLLLTLVLGSAAVEATKNRKELESLQAAYEAKFGVLESATERIRRREPVDIAAEIKLANSLTRNKYNSLTDLHLDEQFESFLKMAEDEHFAFSDTEANVEQEASSIPITSPAVPHWSPERVPTSYKLGFNIRENETQAYNYPSFYTYI
ncbi:hypothetical protein JCM33374_g384 [Metschnikowia sp. JCM 33374]|nr:hypothetical protein JCM33374_g384 [Metschnikowia sp. JCM 33374]